ncbi:carboxypeptidase-like regulatory domain-containing protein [Pedobacter frigiditerrae]|uniref:carboxypeptidase-like regulatory domain-containing protein n=1 Tax=Pedobacter frigiditerrae TaxID=2530452 RepID=UPI00292D0AB5|nr:carboxypeptidase-like regulatory domain-containing protein [Pedobacter frigiditerrae]
MKRLFLSFLLLLSISSFAQIELSGVIKDSVSNETLSSVNVFLQNASNHTQTTVNGAFLLRNIKPGRYTLIASAVGYERHAQAVSIGQTNSNVNIKLKPQLTQLNEVVIQHLSEQKREAYYKLFFNSFIGTSSYATKCTILNPKSLNISYDSENKLLEVSSDTLLIVRNPTIGYEVKILLDQFTLNLATNLVTYKGNLYFEDLKGTPVDVRRWEKARAQLYNGSIKHFYKSLFQKTLAKDGFVVHPISSELDSLRPPQHIIENNIKKFKNGNKDSLAYWQEQDKLPEFRHRILRNVLLKEVDLVKPTTEPGLFEITFDKHLYVISKNKLIGDSFNPTTTILTLQSDKAIFDLNGILVGKNAIVYEGDNMERIADLLPYNYAPTNEPLISIASAKPAIKGDKDAQQNFSPLGKIYLQTDRETYIGGDDIWYSVYLTKPIEAQTIYNYNLYVELISAQQALVTRQVIELKNDRAAADIKLPDSMKAGKYWLRAYISPKQNHANYAIFEKQINIIGLNENVVNLADHKIEQDNEKPIIQFFPEGGTLVNGISTHIAYKIRHSSPQNLKGSIVNAQGDVICSINPDRTGLGSFMFLPLAGNQYWFKAIDEEKKTIMVQLPRASEKGMSFFIKDVDSLLQVFISCDDKTAQESLHKNLKLEIRHQGEVISAKDFSLKSSQFSLKIDKQVFLPGINQITLSNQQGIPQCERLVFVYPKEYVNVKLQHIVQPTNDVATQIKIVDLNGEPLKGNFSVAVIDGDLIEENNADIHSNVLLQAVLKEKIENINYYFDALNKNRFKQMDLLMLTKDKNDLKWELRDAVKSRKNLPVEQGINITGAVVDERKKLPVKQANITVRIPKAEGVKIFSGQTDALGRFSVANLSLYGLQDVIVTSKNAKGEPLGMVILDSILKDTLAINYGHSILESQLPINNKKDSVLLERKKAHISSGIQLKAVEITGKKKITLLNGIVLDGGYPSENFSITNKDNEFHDVRHYLLTKSNYATQESSRIMYVCNGEHDNCTHEPIAQRYPGYCKCDTENPLEKTFTEDRNRVMFMSDGLQVMPKVFLNGREVVWDEVRDEGTAAMMYNEFLTMRMDKFESIEIKKVLIVPTLAQSATVAPGYLLYLNTKPGVMLNMKSEKLVKTLNTYYRNRTFNNRVEDADFKIEYKPTLYWNPSVSTDENGNANINFRLSKSNAKFFIRVEGLTENGNIISASSSYHAN